MDQEVEAMAALTQALEALDADTRSRVLRWAADRYGVTVAKSLKGKVGAVDATTEVESETEATFETLADLFVAAAPKTAAEKVLVAGYWFQVLKKQTDLSSFEVNKELKQLGHAVDTINHEFDRLMDQKPQLAVQLKKSGSAKQARKKYKITEAGIKKVRSMIGAPKNES